MDRSIGPMAIDAAITSCLLLARRPSSDSGRVATNVKTRALQEK